MSLQNDVTVGCDVFTGQLWELLQEHDFTVHDAHIELTETGIIYIFQADLFDIPVEGLAEKLRALMGASNDATG